MKLADRLAELRREHGLTLRQLRGLIEHQTGERTSISYLSEIERGQAIPSIVMLTRLARAYEVSLQALLAAVDFYDGEMSAEQPASLREFAHARGLSSEWVETLARVEHRGKRPDTQIEWEAIYGMLRAFLEPKLSPKKSGR